MSVSVSFASRGSTKKRHTVSKKVITFQLLKKLTFNHSVDFGLDEHHLLCLFLGNLAGLDEALGGTGNGVALSPSQLGVVAFDLEKLVVVRLA